MTLEDLIDALGKATGPDRELDTKIWLLTTSGATRRTQHIVSSTGAWPTYDIDETRDATGALIIVPAVTASIDAAVTLVEQVRPDWRIENLCEWDHERLRDRGPWMCDLVERGKDCLTGKSAKCAHAPTPAIALVLATLRSLHQEKNND